METTGAFTSDKMTFQCQRLLQKAQIFGASDLDRTEALQMRCNVLGVQKPEATFAQVFWRYTVLLGPAQVYETY